MTTVVIMPGGFHPFHPGHLALYQSAQRAFPDAEVYVAATNDKSDRPFDISEKQKIAYAAGVEPGHFVQVKSPFRAEEIASQYNPNRDVLIFVRSEKDANTQPQAGGVKKDGSASYLQPLLGAKRLEPFAQHAYMAYLPTVEFGPGAFTSASQIRTAWPKLTPKRRLALVMSLYPSTQKDPAGAQDIVSIFDQNIGSVDEGVWGNFKAGMKKSGEVQAFYVVPKFLDLQIKGLIQDNNPNSNLWNMLKKDIADLPSDVQTAINELLDNVDLEISHWPRGLLGGSKNIDTQRTKNLITILRKIKSIVELNNPDNKSQSVDEDISRRGFLQGTTAAAGMAAAGAVGAKELARPTIIAIVRIGDQTKQFNLGTKFDTSKQAEDFVTDFLNKQGIQHYTIEIQRGYTNENQGWAATYEDYVEERRL